MINSIRSEIKGNRKKKKKDLTYFSTDSGQRANGDFEMMMTMTTTMPQQLNTVSAGPEHNTSLSLGH